MRSLKHMCKPKIRALNFTVKCMPAFVMSEVYCSPSFVAPDALS